MATNYSPRLQSALDLRAFLTEVKAAGELKEISGAHWHLELGAFQPSATRLGSQGPDLKPFHVSSDEMDPEDFRKVFGSR